jgi:hypothetical protein
MIYQAQGLVPNQTVFDFMQVTEKTVIGTETITHYSSPFSFYLNGNSNLYGYKIEIYRNGDNVLVYDTGVVTKAVIQSTNENESSISPYTEEYNIFPFEGGEQINITPILPNGNNVKINVFLDSLINNALNTISDPNYNNCSYNWVLKQYYVQSNDGTVNTFSYVRNPNTFFVAKEQLYVGVKAFVYNELDQEVVIDQLMDVKNRQIYFEGKLLHKDSVKGLILDKTNNYEIIAARWVVELINITDSTQTRIEKDTGWIITSSLHFNYDGFLKLNEEERFYKLTLYVRYKYGGESYITSMCQVLSNGTFKEGDIIIKPTYGTSDISDILKATGEVCQKENYVKLEWNATGITGRFYENGLRISGKELNARFKNISLGYDATDDEIINETERCLTALQVNNYNKDGKYKNESVVYSSDF